ncbi:uncharacterized protein Fot_34038 [Forsythia ovata]|uniref:Uncharacterized protein n=1 Tax=Forsythia ovata TaxID=205694 RepID=A0ABD1TBY1_9LAMI
MKKTHFFSQTSGKRNWVFFLINTSTLLNQNWSSFSFNTITLLNQLAGNILFSSVASISDEDMDAGIEKNEAVIDLQLAGTTTHEVNGGSANVASSINKDNWIEKNFHEFEPISQMIGVGFRDNYLVARENTNPELEFKG